MFWLRGWVAAAVQSFHHAKKEHHAKLLLGGAHLILFYANSAVRRVLSVCVWVYAKCICFKHNLIYPVRQTLNDRRPPVVLPFLEHIFSVVWSYGHIRSLYTIYYMFAATIERCALVMGLVSYLNDVACCTKHRKGLSEWVVWDRTARGICLMLRWSGRKGVKWKCGYIYTRWPVYTLWHKVAWDVQTRIKMWSNV